MDSIRLPRNKIYEPIYQIKTARELYLFSLRICNMLSTEEISDSAMDKAFTVENITISGQWNSSDIDGLTMNLRLCVLGNTFIIIDEALDQIFGKKPKLFSHTDVDSLRAIIYSLRCAIAHGPTAPVWKAKGMYSRNFYIKEINYELKLKELNGLPVHHSHYHGQTGALSLIDYSLSIAEKYFTK